MKRARFSEEQIINILKEAEGGAKVTELCRRHGISDAPFYTWRSKSGGLEVSEMRRLRQLEEENRQLKSVVADQGAGPSCAEGRAGKKRIRPAVNRRRIAIGSCASGCGRWLKSGAGGAVRCCIG
jgi:putative transposase